MSSLNYVRSMLITFTSFITAFIITYFAVPSVLRVASIRKLFDIPDERKVHKETIPALGGIAIFAGIFFSVLFWTDTFRLDNLRWLILSFVIMFLMGLKDDIVAIKPLKKLAGEIVAAGIIIFYGNIRIYSLQGLLGIYELPFLLSILLTLFVFIVIINAFNLIDGIDGLAGGIGTIASLAFGGFLLYSSQHEWAAISFAVTGALLAFLNYNFQPAKIFMGDGGSLVIGFILSILCVRFLNTPVLLDVNKNLFLPAPAIALSILIIPLTDTLRVFIIRILNGKSPFHADRNHIHHLLLNSGCNHKQAALILYAVNVLFICGTLAFVHYNLNGLFFIIVLIAGICTLVPSFLSNLNKQRVEEGQVINT